MHDLIPAVLEHCVFETLTRVTLRVLLLEVFCDGAPCFNTMLPQSLAVFVCVSICFFNRPLLRDESSKLVDLLSNSIDINKYADMNAVILTGSTLALVISLV